MTQYEPDDFAFAMGIGVGGDLVDVTDDVMWNESGITRSWGNKSAFQATNPGSYQFVLKNHFEPEDPQTTGVTGQYTPDNPNSPLAVTPFEGMECSWQVNDDLRHGIITSIHPLFSGNTPEGARLVVTVGDALTTLSRTDIEGSLYETLLTNSEPYAFWLMNEVTGHDVILDSIGNNHMLNFASLGQPDRVPILRGYAAPNGFDAAETQSRWVTAAVNISEYGRGVSYIGADGRNGIDQHWAYEPGELGWFSFFYTHHGFGNPQNSGFFQAFWGTYAGGFTGMNLIWYGGGSTWGCYMGIDDQGGSGAGDAMDGPILVDDTTYHIAIRVYYTGSNGTTCNIHADLYVDGVFAGSLTKTGGTPDMALRPYLIDVEWYNLNVAQGANLNAHVTLSHMVHSANRINLHSLIPGSLGTRLEAMFDGTDTPYDTIPDEFYAVPYPGGSTDPSTFLGGVQEVLDTSQGYIYTKTTGTLLAPDEKVMVRWRDRPTSDEVTASLSAKYDILDQPGFVRDITDFVSRVNVSGIDISEIVTRNNLHSRVGTASASLRTLYTEHTDLRAAGQDRILRGTPRGVGIISVKVDARSTGQGQIGDASRWDILTEGIPGNRYRITDLPEDELGYDEIDVWLIGGREVHDGERHLFEWFFEPVLEDHIIYQSTSATTGPRYAAAGKLSLSASATSGATTISVATTGPKFTVVGANLPVDIIIDDEELRVTAATGATPQVLTVTRGVNGTTAAAHSSGALVELARTYVYDY